MYLCIYGRIIIITVIFVSSTTISFIQGLRYWDFRNDLLWISVDGLTKCDVTVIIPNAPGHLADRSGNEGFVVSTPAV